MLVKASIIHLETLERFAVLWNPSSYSLARESRFAAPPLPGGRVDAPRAAAGAAERFSTRLFLDSTASEGPARNLLAAIELLDRWSEPSPDTGLPPRLLFSWGPFRFRGYLEAKEEEWVRFDPDGTPVRGWLDLTLRR